MCFITKIIQKIDVIFDKNNNKLMDIKQNSMHVNLLLNTWSNIYGKEM